MLTWITANYILVSIITYPLRNCTSSVRYIWNKARILCDASTVTNKGYQRCQFVKSHQRLRNHLWLITRAILLDKILVMLKYSQEPCNFNWFCTWLKHLQKRFKACVQNSESTRSEIRLSYCLSWLMICVAFFRISRRSTRQVLEIHHDHITSRLLKPDTDSFNLAAVAQCSDTAQGVTCVSCSRDRHTRRLCAVTTAWHS